jgi:1-deoxy-D-xylulose-5-phosphate reductoisomerase
MTPATAAPTTATTVSLIGSTGSIGTQAIEVIESCPERFTVVALGAQSSIKVLADQARRFHPSVVAIGDDSLAPDLSGCCLPASRW